MKNFKITGFCAILGLAFISSVSQANPTTPIGQIYTAILCPDGYQNVVVNDLTDWQVCIASEFFAGDAVDEEPHEKSCPTVVTDTLRQEWNPEAAVCFQISTAIKQFATKNSTGNSDVVTVTRDADLRRMLIDMYDNLAAAGCDEQSNEAHVMSPSGAYCLKDVGNVHYTYSEIEAYAEAYLEYIYSCSNADQALDVENAFNAYLHFAYYENANILIEYFLKRVNNVTLEVSNNNQIFNTGFGYTDTIDPTCGRIRKLIGVTNY